MQQANAILAINSLDRYITTARVLSGNLTSAWNANTSNITYSKAAGVIPVVGATVVSTGTGWPVGNITIISVDNTFPNFPSFAISALTTADSITSQTVTQSYAGFVGNTPKSDALVAQYNQAEPYSNSFTIQSPGSLIYGYIHKIIVSQIQMQYNIPTVSFNKNDKFTIARVSSGTTTFGNITIPFGFYPPTDLAAALQSLINANPTLAPLNMTVSFDARDGFTFTTLTADNFYFPNPPAIPGVGLNAENIFKTYRLLGITKLNNQAASTQTSAAYPIFLYTPYIDIYSDVLTNYQDVKDTNTATTKFKGLIARVYLSSTGNIQSTSNASALGIEPFVLTADLNTPKIIQWTPDVAVPSIDIQLYDQYSDLIPGPAEGFSTEFQMTLLCVE
jgi:hypothetical protein